VVEHRQHGGLQLLLSLLCVREEEEIEGDPSDRQADEGQPDDGVAEAESTKPEDLPAREAMRGTLDEGRPAGAPARAGRASGWR
jgi:hypothetical protein